jgi:TRIAD3 protein (E3 ubiquitin-protein ligase RNF216)
MPAFGAGAAVDMLGAQRQFQRELEEQHARLMLEQAARRERTMADIQGNMYMAVPMPPLPPIPQVQPLRHQLHYQPLQHQPLYHPMLRPPVMPRLPPVPLPVAARRRSRKH